MSLQHNLAATRHAIYCAAVVMLLCSGMYYYQFTHLPLFKQDTSLHLIKVIALKQGVVTFCAAFLSALMGLLYAKRLHLPGWGRMPRSVLFYLAALFAGLLGAGLSYLLFDQQIMQHVPAIYPDTLIWALVMLLAGVVAQETILRLGLLTVLLYFLQRWRPHAYPWPAFLIISLFSGYGSYLYLAKFNLTQAFPFWLFSMAFLFNFVLQWIYCHCYVRFGLWMTLVLHALFSVKFLVYALIQ